MSPPPVAPPACRQSSGQMIVVSGPSQTPSPHRPTGSASAVALTAHAMARTTHRARFDRLGTRITLRPNLPRPPPRVSSCPQRRPARRRCASSPTVSERRTSEAGRSGKRSRLASSCDHYGMTLRLHVAASDCPAALVTWRRSVLVPVLSPIGAVTRSVTPGKIGSVPISETCPSRVA
jgi:hypothetical protein